MPMTVDLLALVPTALWDTYTASYATCMLQSCRCANLKSAKLSDLLDFLLVDAN